MHPNKTITLNFNSANDMLNSLLSNITKSKRIAGVILFSRQIPEMEIISGLNFQPQMSNYPVGSLLAVHGTISNDKILTKMYQLNNIELDTDVARYFSLTSDTVQGIFAAVSMQWDPDKKDKKDKKDIIFETKTSGLDLWDEKIITKGKFLVEVISTTSSKIQPNILLTSQVKSKETKDKTLYVACSGGMDISLSVFKALSEKKYTKCILVYFSWGTKAQEQEQESIRKLGEYLCKKYPDTIFESKSKETTLLMKKYLSCIGADPVSLLTGELQEQETETASAYVPYRNTLFAILLAGSAEAENLKDVDILFGLNLTEGMVYSDNSEQWLKSTNKVIRFGGKDPQVTGTYNLISPYMNRTKTNTLIEFNAEFPDILPDIMKISFSCYYPKNGIACNECGSCILRKKAQARSK